MIWNKSNKGKVYRTCEKIPYNGVDIQLNSAQLVCQISEYIFYNNLHMYFSSQSLNIGSFLFCKKYLVNFF